MIINWTKKKRVQSQQSLAEYPSFLENLGGEDGFSMEDLNSVLSFDSFDNLKSQVSRLLKAFSLSICSVMTRTVTCLGRLEHGKSWPC